MSGTLGLTWWQSAGWNCIIIFFLMWSEWVKSLSRVRLFATPWIVGAYHVSLSMGFSRQEYWSGLQFPSPTQGSNPGLLHYRQMLYCLSHQGSLNVEKAPQLSTPHTPLLSLWILFPTPGGIKIKNTCPSTFLSLGSRKRDLKETMRSSILRACPQSKCHMHPSI